MTSLMNLKMTQKREGGFTLLELLIVIAIIAILSIALVFMLNPAETLKKARDSQRISDLKTVKTALGIMLTSTTTPSLDGTFGAASAICLTNTSGTPTAQVGDIAYSVTVAPTGITGAPAIANGDAFVGSTFSGTGYVATGAAGKVDGTGWIPVNLKALVGGTPISSFPVDPVNTVTSGVAITDPVYRYACQNATTAASGKPAFVFEINAVLESTAFGVGGTDDKSGKDGGDHASMFESGNSLNLLPISGAF